MNKKIRGYSQIFKEDYYLLYKELEGSGDLNLVGKRFFKLMQKFPAGRVLFRTHPLSDLKKLEKKGLKSGGYFWEIPKKEERPTDGGGFRKFLRELFHSWGEYAVYEKIPQGNKFGKYMLVFFELANLFEATSVSKKDVSGEEMPDSLNQINLPSKLVIPSDCLFKPVSLDKNELSSIEDKWNKFKKEGSGGNQREAFISIYVFETLMKKLFKVLAGR